MNQRKLAVQLMWVGRLAVVTLLAAGGLVVHGRRPICAAGQRERGAAGCCALCDDPVAGAGR